MTEQRRNRPGSLVFGIVVGLAVAWGAYQWITDTERRELRALQERAVLAARVHVAETIARNELEIVDPLEPRRSVGKVYVYDTGGGFEVSGYYRRDDADGWHPYLASLAADTSLIHLKVQDDDAGLLARAAVDSALSVVN